MGVFKFLITQKKYVMKNRLQFIFAVILSFNCVFATYSFAISSTDTPSAIDITYDSQTYFLEEAAEVIAFLAHPSSEIYSTSVSSKGSYGIISVTYKSAWTGDYFDAKFKVGFGSGKFIRSIDVISDEAFMPAFTATTNVKDIIADILIEDEDAVYEAASVVERFTGKDLSEFDGGDLCLLILNCISLSI